MMAASNPSTGRPPSKEFTARKRFISKFIRKAQNEVHNGETTTGWAAGKPPKPKKVLKHKPFTVWSQLRATIFKSPLNILLLAVPAGFVVNYLHLNPIAVFFVNFGAILPLTTLFSYAIDEVRLRYKGALGMLVYMSFG
jgi:Ca2+:H+ antiporter